MKYSEMNKTQQKAVRNIYHAANWLIGGLENTCMDNSKDSVEYKKAESLLEDHDALVKELYSMATTSIFDEGCMCFDERTVTKELREINFCGKDWLMERCDKRISKMEEEGFCY